MIRILFICHGNICRSPAAALVFSRLAAERGLAVVADSAATTDEELGNDIYPPMRRALLARGFQPARHAARRITAADYHRYDRIVCMDRENLGDLRRLTGGDPQGRISMLMDWTGERREVSDPWYTRDFEQALDDIGTGCAALLDALCGEAAGQP